MTEKEKTAGATGGLSEQTRRQEPLTMSISPRSVHRHSTPQPGRQLRLLPRDPAAADREGWRRLAIAIRDGRHRLALERLARALSRRCPQCGRVA